MKPVLFLITVTLLVTFVAADPYTLSIIHINDFHARYEATDTTGGICDPGEECIGGYARTVYTVKRLLKENEGRNVVYFNAGDSFQGTLWYNVGRWNVTSQFLNMLPADAMTLGNHEFDHGVEGVVPFLETLKSPMLVANMDSRDEPTITGKYNKSMIIERGGRKIGVVGVILETTYDLANTGKLIFSNESAAIREEAAKLRALGANIIIGISHCGYDVDKLIAEHAADDIDVIVGAHSHTFLYPTGKPQPGPDTPRGDYPTEIIHKNGHRVLIVQAMAYAKYVGYIEVTFDDDGNVISHNGAPLYMGADVPQDEEVTTAMQPWKEVIDVQGDVVYGETLVTLDKSACGSRECNLGNFYCDAMIHAFTNLAPYDQPAWTNVAIGIINTGALRVPLYKGNLTFAHLVTMSPFENILTSFNLPGDKLKEALEFSVQPIDIANGVTTSYIFLHVAGLKVTFNFTKPAYERVVDIKTRCETCKIPIYEQFNATKIYRIVTPNFLADGGDGFGMFRDYGTDRRKYFLADLTFAHLVTMSPFENILTSFNLPGDKLKEALEFSVQPIDIANGVTTSHIFLHVAGLQITFNFTKPAYERVIDLKTRCKTFKIPIYEKFNASSIYRIVTPNFLADGGGGFSMFREYGTDRRPEMTDLDALLSYTSERSPIYAGVERRITVVK